MGVAGLALIAKRRKSQSDEWALPVFWIVSAITAILGCFWFLIFDLSQPTIYPNPDLAASRPRPLPRLLPLPRMSDAPQLADLPNEPPSPLTAFARTPDQREVMSESPARKRHRVTAGENEQRTSDYGQRWDYGIWRPDQQSCLERPSQDERRSQVVVLVSWFIVATIKSARSNDAAQTELAQRQWFRVAGPRDRAEHPYPMISACASYCNSRNTRSGSAADAVHRR